jgi:hypothetical protein
VNQEQIWIAAALHASQSGMDLFNLNDIIASAA